MSYAAPLDALFLLAKYQVYALLFLVGFVSSQSIKKSADKRKKTFFFLLHIYSINLKGII